MKVNNIFILIVVVLLSGCASISGYAHKGFPVCAIQMSVEGNTRQLKYFRENVGVYINNAAGYPLVKAQGSDNNINCKPKYDLFVKIKLIKEFAYTKRKGFANQHGNTSGGSEDINHYIYHYELRLIKKGVNKLIYSQSSDEVTSYTDFKKARKWSAQRIAYDLRVAGMLSPEIY